jgi:hypothetical protein
MAIGTLVNAGSGGPEECVGRGESRSGTEGAIMSIGTSIVRAPGSGRGASRSTSVREVCLIGVDHQSPRRLGAWAPGREIRWLGRTYEVRAADADPELPSRRYVHLSARAED